MESIDFRVNQCIFKVKGHENITFAISTKSSSIRKIIKFVLFFIILTMGRESIWLISREPGSRSRSSNARSKRAKFAYMHNIHVNHVFLSVRRTKYT